MIVHLHTIKIVINFNSLKTFFFYVIIHPTCQRYILHNLHGHPSGTHLLILNFKALRDSDSFISLGPNPVAFGPR